MKVPKESSFCEDYSVERIKLSESEIKRRKSLHERKASFKSKELLIKNALNSVDSKQQNNKIIFKDDDDEVEGTDSLKHIKGKKELFDNDEEQESKDDFWDEQKIEAKAKFNDKLLQLQTKVGNDERFKIDERFIDKEIKREIKEDDDKEDEINEKEWQLGILENVLGKPLSKPIKQDDHTSKSLPAMLRYDPTAENHEDFEIKVEKPSKNEKPAKKKKKKLSISETIEEEKIPVSTDIFFEVSDKLKDSLVKTEGFSLLKALGKDTEDETNGLEDKVKESKPFQFNFTSKNPFKYDSSDDEDIKNPETINDNKAKPSKQTISINESKLFFSPNDPRFQEAENFFKQRDLSRDENFSKRRRELKQIVKKKIRNKLKKSMPWKNKKVLKVQKSL